MMMVLLSGYGGTKISLYLEKGLYINSVRIMRQA